jgi:hypothetical protein
MTTGYSNSPQLAKAALISMGGGNPVPRLIVLQYNPEQLTRTLVPVFEKTGDTPTGTDQLAGPPEETISLQARISAIDQLQANDPVAIGYGIHPQLATLELMLFPSSAAIVADVAKMALGLLEVVPPDAPVTIFVWGTRRVLPVQMAAYNVVETLHDPSLNPVDAEVTMDLKVLTYQDFTPTQAGFYIYLANLAQREVMSALGGVASASSLLASILKS